MKQIDEVNKLTEYLSRTMRLGYSIDEAWQKMLDTNDLTSDNKKLKCINLKLRKPTNIKTEITKTDLIARLACILHYEYNIDYTEVFNNVKIVDLLKICENDVDRMVEWRLHNG